MSCCDYTDEHLGERIASLPRNIYAGSDPKILARNTHEHCAVVRLGDTVVKFIRPEIYDHNRVRVARSWEIRAKVAAAHPDLFAAIDFHPGYWWVLQPWVEGRPATTAEKIAVAEEVGTVRKMPYVSDFGGNVIVTPDGKPVIVDFRVAEELKDRYEREARRHKRRRR